MNGRATLKWIALALAGVVVAAGVAVAGSRLASRQIGLASEPITAGDALAPAVVTHERPHPRRSAKPPASPRAPTAPAGAPPASEATPHEPTPPEPPPPAEPGFEAGGGETGDDGGGGSGGGADD